MVSYPSFEVSIVKIKLCLFLKFCLFFKASIGEYFRKNRMYFEKDSYRWNILQVTVLKVSLEAFKHQKVVQLLDQNVK